MTETGSIQPPFERTVLDSGVRVLTSNMPHTGAVSIQVLFGAGSRYETDELAGSSHLFEHLLFSIEQEIFWQVLFLISTIDLCTK